MMKLLNSVRNFYLKGLNRYYSSRPKKYSYNEISVIVQPTVFPPFLTLSTKVLLEFVESLNLEQKTFLELGCGCGIISILASKKGAIVTASDINEIALSALAENCKSNNVQIEIVKSNLFDSLQGRSFDVILVNPPYYPKNPVSVAESAWYCGEDHYYFRAFFNQIKSRIHAKSDFFMILSENCNLAKIVEIAQENGIELVVVLEKIVNGERNVIFKLLDGSSKPI